MLEHMEDGELCPTLPKPINLAKRGNRARQKLRPSEPTDLQFTLDKEYIPASFVRADIQVQGRRHIVLASDNMVSLLQQAKTWYIDATFKVVKDPFNQLFTVHAFVYSTLQRGEVPLYSSLRRFPIILVTLHR